MKKEEMITQAAAGAALAMVCAARTAPKTRGIDNIEIVLIDDDKSKKSIIEKMKEISERENRPSFKRDADSISLCPAVVIIGVKHAPAGLNCSYCGYKTCEELKKTPGICAYNSIDLGIAISSAVDSAALHKVDNRIMYSIGRSSLDLKLFSSDVKQALGIPLSITGKNPFFDRK